MTDAELKKLELLGIKPLDSIEAEKLDILLSAKYRSDEILISSDRDLVVKSAYNMSITSVKEDIGGEHVYLIPGNLFDRLRDYIVSENARDVEIQVGNVNFDKNHYELDKTEVAKVLTNILNSAKNKNASDIHVLPKENSTEIAFRENGDLIVNQRYPYHYAGYIINKLKNEAKMDISNKLTPQDGKLFIKVENEMLELRINTLPTVFGEKAAIRLQKADGIGKRSLDRSGFVKEDLEIYRDKFQESNGLILNVGATGAGKSTTFAVTLQELHAIFPYKNIITVEDPVEMRNPDITQVEVNEKQGRTFEVVLRSLMRQDPDIILIGEIRDKETAIMGSQAALTGHLVLGTLHANDSFDAITRLRGMGIDNETIAGIAACFLSQALVKTLCSHCKEERPISESDIKRFNLDFSTQYEPVGCAHCNGTGFSEREAVVEVLPIDTTIKQCISKGLDPIEIKKIMKPTGFRNLWHNALIKVKEGKTTLHEVRSKIKRDSVFNYN